MRKVLIAILIFVFLLCGCASNSKKNSIYGVSKEKQEEFVENNDIKIPQDFSLAELLPYDVEQSFESIRVWAEAYQDGKLTNKTELLEGNFNSEKGRGSGAIAMYFSEDEEKILFKNITETGEQESELNVADLFEEQEIVRFARGSLDEDDIENVEKNKEYAIISIQYNDEEPPTESYIPFLESIMEDPTELEKVPYIIVVKCEFGS